MIVTRSDDELARMREAGRLNGCVHQVVRQVLSEGMTTREIDETVGDVLKKLGGQSSFRSLLSFPGHACISVNNGVGHGVPNETVLSQGDVVKVDVGVEFEGYHSDAAATYIVGQGTAEAKELVEVTQRALYAGIQAAQNWQRISDVSYAMEQKVRQAGFQVVRHAFGHGVGRHLHEDPQIAPFGPQGLGPRLRPGMVIAIEPVVVAGRPHTFVGHDGWSTYTQDGSLSAHFEHTILITEAGPEILTLPNHPSPITDLVGEWKIPLQRDPLIVQAKTPLDDNEILVLAQTQMNPILAEAWGRPVTPNEVLNPDGGTTFVIRDNVGVLAGFFTLSQQGAAVHLVSLVVHPLWQGRGLGRLIMQQIECFACANSRPLVTLCVQTTNTRARCFYETLGYTAMGTPFFNTIAMRKPIPPSNQETDGTSDMIN